MRIWNFAELRQEADLEGHSDRITCVVISNDNKFIVSSSEDKTVRNFRSPEETIRNRAAGAY